MKSIGGGLGSGFALTALAVTVLSCLPSRGEAQDLTLPEGSFSVVNLVWLADGPQGKQLHDQYLEEATPILEEHGGRVTVQLIVESGWIGDSPPDRITIVSWPDATSLQAFVTDARYREVVGLRGQALSRSEAFIAREEAR